MTNVQLALEALRTRIEVIEQGGGGGGIPDAPADDNIYGRRNHRWVEVDESYDHMPVTTGALVISDCRKMQSGFMQNILGGRGWGSQQGLVRSSDIDGYTLAPNTLDTIECGMQPLTMYAVLRTVSPTFDPGGSLFGTAATASGAGRFLEFGAAINGYFHQFVASTNNVPSTIPAVQMAVGAVIVNGSTYRYYVDGVFIGQNTYNSGFYNGWLMLGGRRAGTTISQVPATNMRFRYVSAFSEIHTEPEVIANSLWLKNEFIDNYDPSKYGAPPP